jgi:hypothetical protein
VISDEAVEAAHKAWRSQASAEGTIFEYNLRAALEAAVPFIAAEAWHRGYVSALHNVEFYSATTNPYRSQT